MEIQWHANVFTPEYLKEYEVYDGKRTFKSTEDRNEEAKKLRKQGWKVKSYSYSDFCGFAAHRKRESSGTWGKSSKGNRIYDNGGKTYDRYTLINSENEIFGFNEDPFHPQGFGQFAGDWEGGSTRHLGKKITAASLPVKARQYVKQMSETEPKKKAKVAKFPVHGTWNKCKTKKVRAKVSKCR